MVLQIGRGLSHFIFLGWKECKVSFLWWTPKVGGASYLDPTPHPLFLFTSQSHEIVGGAFCFALKGKGFWGQEGSWCSPKATTRRPPSHFLKDHTSMKIAPFSFLTWEHRGLSNVSSHSVDVESWPQAVSGVISGAMCIRHAWTIHTLSCSMEKPALQQISDQTACSLGKHWVPAARGKHYKGQHSPERVWIWIRTLPQTLTFHSFPLLSVRPPAICLWRLR